MDIQDKEKSFTIKCCKREYKIIHKNKRNINNTNLNYLGIIFYIIKNIWFNFVDWIDFRLIPFCDNYNISNFIKVFISLNLIAILPTICIFTLVAALTGGTEHYNSIIKCTNNFRDCDIYKKYCHQNIDDKSNFWTDSNIYGSRKLDIDTCIASNTYMINSIFRQIGQLYYYICYFYYYLIIGFIISYLVYLVIDWCIYKINTFYKKTKETINREIPIVEEV